MNSLTLRTKEHRLSCVATKEAKLPEPTPQTLYREVCILHYLALQS